MFRTTLISLLLLFVTPSFADNAIKTIAGSRDTATVAAALSAKEEWFRRAINVCVEEDYCQKSFAIRTTIEPDGSISDCQLVNSDIKKPSIADLFCKVAKSTKFAPHDSRFVFEFPILVRIFAKDGKESCPENLGNRDSNATFVAQCLDSYLEVINSIQQSLIRIYKTPEADVTGSIALELTIKPSGKASKIKVIETSIHDHNLVDNIKAIIEQINFGPSNEKTAHNLFFSVPFDGMKSAEGPGA